MCTHNHSRRKKSVLLLLPDDISIKELMNPAHVGANFYDKSKFEDNTIHKTKNGVDWIFSDIENKHKNLHHIFDDDDDDDDDDDLNTHSPFTVNKILYGSDSNSPLKDEGYDHEDEIINSEYYPLINRIKSEYI